MMQVRSSGNNPKRYAAQFTKTQTLFLDTITSTRSKGESFRKVENIITTNDDLYKSIVADKKA